MVIQKFTSKVIRMDHLTKDVFVVGLEAPKDFTFEAGQFVSLKIDNGEKCLSRAYSILNPPSKDGLELCIKLVRGGFASEYFKTIKVGDEFEVRGPFGRFVFDQDLARKDHYFVGTGTGVVPLYSMITEFLPKRLDTQFYLFFGVRSRDDLFYHDEFQALAKKFPNFNYLPSLTRDPGWGGAEGRVHTHVPQDVKNKTFYICGLPALVDDTTKLLFERGAKKADVKFEKY